MGEYDETLKTLADTFVENSKKLVKEGKSAGFIIGSLSFNMRALFESLSTDGHFPMAIRPVFFGNKVRLFMDYGQAMDGVATVEELELCELEMSKEVAVEIVTDMFSARIATVPLETETDAGSVVHDMSHVFKGGGDDK